MRDEGVIKFECRWRDQNLEPNAVPEELIVYRNRLFDLGLIGVYPDGIGFGNVSVRLADGQFVVSGSQTGEIAAAAAEHFAIVTEYSIADNWVRCRGAVPASSESLTHALIYEKVAAANAVIHVHNANLWQKLIGEVPTTPASVPYGTPAMADAVSRLLRDAALERWRILAMAGHEDGIVTFGVDLEQALDTLLAQV